MICFSNNIINHKNKQKITFAARKEYVDYDNSFDVRASNWFRRSRFYGPQSEDFQHIINTLADIYKNKLKINLLIVGIGQGQEPLSFLTSIKALNPRKKLKNVVNLSCVDLQPKDLDEKEWKISNFDKDDTYFPQMFTKNPNDYCGYPLTEISDYYRNTLNDPAKSKFDTFAIEFARESKPKIYDVVSCNNTLIYGKSRREGLQSLRGLAKIVKTGGVLITDAFVEFDKVLSKNFKKLYPGIHRKGL